MLLLQLALASAAHGVVRPAIASVARPALRLGGEWAGNCIEFSPKTGLPEKSNAEAIVSEEWRKSDAAGEAVIHRRAIRQTPSQQAGKDDQDVSHAVLPLACSGATVLRLGAAMLEADVLNARAWTLDAAPGANDGARSAWRCETVFDGLGGARPTLRADAVECPMERTRVECLFDPSTGMLDPTAPVLVWQERCWSTSPSDELQRAMDGTSNGEGGLDPDWVSAAVGFESFEDASVARVATASAAATLADAAELDAHTLSLALGGGGIQLVGRPGLLELSLTSGAGARNGYSSVVVKRSWAGGDDFGRSMFAEVETFDDTTGNQ